jgi:low temperature requirement protein LtrA
MPRVLRAGDGRVTQIELFFDLVYVFAVTQLAHLLVTHTTVDSAVRTAVLLAMVWQVWIYTTWMTNYLNPDTQPMRLGLIALMLASLVLAAAIPEAFSSRGWLVAAMYVAMQVGRSLIVATGLHGHRLEYVFWRAGAWCVLGAVPMLIGAAVHGHGREALWALAVAIEIGGAAIGFPTPGIGRSATREWTIDGRHFAERCQAFVLIALGESLVVSGGRLTELLHAHLDTNRIIAFGAAFFAAVALWWVYFDRSAADSAEEIARSDDPGRLGRNAFHWVHPIIVAGIIVSAAADEVVLAHPTDRGVMSTAWLVLGGVALFLAGHAIFKAIVWRLVSWPRVIAVVVLAGLLAVAPHVTAIVLGMATLAVVIAVAVADRVQHGALAADSAAATD